MLTAPGQLNRCELFFIVLLEGRAEFGDDVGGRYRKGLDICIPACQTFVLNPDAVFVFVPAMTSSSFAR